MPSYTPRPRARLEITVVFDRKNEHEGQLSIPFNVEGTEGELRKLCRRVGKVAMPIIRAWQEEQQL